MKNTPFRASCFLAGLGLLLATSHAAQATITDITLALERPDGTPTGVWKTQAGSMTTGPAHLWVAETTPAGNRLKNLHDDPAMVRTDGTYTIMMMVNAGLDPADNPAPKAILTVDFAGGSQVQLKLTKGQTTVTAPVGTASVTLKNLTVTPFNAGTPDWVGDQAAAPDGKHDSPVYFTLVVEAPVQPVMVRNGDDAPVPVVVTNPGNAVSDVRVTNSPLTVAFSSPAKVEVTNPSLSVTLPAGPLPVTMSGTMNVAVQSTAAAKYDNALFEIRGHNNNGPLMPNSIQWFNFWSGAGTPPPDTLFAKYYGGQGFPFAVRDSISKALQNISDSGWELVTASIGGNEADFTAQLVLKRKR